MKTWDALWLNGLLVTCEHGYGLIEQGAIAVKDGHIAWLGKESDLPGPAETLADSVHDLNGYCLTPGLIDCHTHVVFAGNRAKEFEMRLQGVSYEEIARKGGGIHSTVAATRDASEEMLLEQSLTRVKSMLRHGVTTLEIKSGYGLDWETEVKMLRVAQRISEMLPVTVKRTFLGAHTIPKEYHGNVDAYIDFVCNEMIPAVASEKLAEAVDVFCESIAFNLEQTERVFQAAKQYNLAVKCHAEQLSDSGSAALAASYQALSVDHLEFASENSIGAIAVAGTVAVLLPGAFYFLRETQLPPIDIMRQHKVAMAIASDCNPGTSPVTSLLLMQNMACTLFRLTPEEAMLGTTIHAAKALGIAHSHGSLREGKIADFAVWNVKHPAELAYYIGENPLVSRVKNGLVSDVDFCG